MESLALPAASGQVPALAETMTGAVLDRAVASAGLEGRDGHRLGIGRANRRSGPAPTGNVVRVTRQVTFDVAGNRLLKQRRRRPSRIGAGR